MTKSPMKGYKEQSGTPSQDVGCVPRTKSKLSPTAVVKKC